MTHFVKRDIKSAHIEKLSRTHMQDRTFIRKLKAKSPFYDCKNGRK